MRVAGVFLAVLLIAACPPRRGRAVSVQPCPTVKCAPVVVQSVPVAVAPKDEPAPAAKADPVLDSILAAWEKRTTEITTFRAEVAFTRTDAVFKKASNFNGVVLLMRPNYMVMRLDNTDDNTKTDYEAFICDGKKLYAYSGLQKTTTEFVLPDRRDAGVPLLDLFTVMNADAEKARFEITRFKIDDNYIYLDVKPRTEKDRREFTHLRLALYGPGKTTEKFAYLPAQVYVAKPNGDTEHWKFTNPQTNLPGIDEKAFRYVEVREKGWTLRKAPASEEP